MDVETAYEEALEYLYGFVDYSLTHNFPSPEYFDLDRIDSFLKILGNPHKKYPIIHIAGTKGKGSVAAMCASVLQTAGYKVGLYTSPHLSDYAERFQINNRPIQHDQLVTLVDEIKPYLQGDTSLTTFEISTALAFLYFARQGATAVVAEVGLGGRLDATNIVKPVVSVITSISYDHTSVLGETLGDIAAEKAGIIKSGIPVVVAPQRDEALKVIEEIAADRGATLYYVGREYHFAPGKRTLDRQEFLVWTHAERALWQAYQKPNTPWKWEPIRLMIPLLGDHQMENAATAYAALQIARKNGIPVGEQAIKDGLLNVVWPGRFEILQSEPPLIVDCAHNRDSAAKLRQTLDDYYPDRPVLLVFGVSEDKDVAGMLGELAPRVESIITTRSYHPRSMDPEKLAQLSKSTGLPVRAIPRVEDALREALNLVDPQGMILVAGSLFVAAGARDTWYNDSLAGRSH